MPKLTIMESRYSCPELVTVIPEAGDCAREEMIGILADVSTSGVDIRLEHPVGLRR